MIRAFPRGMIPQQEQRRIPRQVPYVSLMILVLPADRFLCGVHEQLLMRVDTICSAEARRFHRRGLKLSAFRGGIFCPGRDEARYMRTTRWGIALAAFAMAAEVWIPSAIAEGPETATPPVASLTHAVLPAPVDPCALAEVAAVPTRPNWDTSTSTTQCGVIETDYGWLDQPVGGGVRQQMLQLSMRYGLTPRLDLRWGLTSHMTQSGGGTAALEGAGDQWLSVRYRFLEQRRIMPSMAFLYGAKIPTANPGKGFGTGFVDHQFVLIASRDLGKNHLDFNTVGTLAGATHGRDGAAQLGLALTRPATRKLSWILESYGGPQPGVPDRFGAALLGGSYVLHPKAVLDAAYTRTYTAGAPRQQFLFGFTCALRPGIASLPRRWAFARLLGR
jgi:hypothetical protein